MARLAIDEDFWRDGRLRNLSNKIKNITPTKTAQATELLLNLWHNSQAELRDRGTAEDILDWCGRNDCGQEIIIGPLLDVGFLEKKGDNEFLIRGNQAHIDVLKVYRERASVGGKAKQEKRLLKLKEVLEAVPEEVLDECLSSAKKVLNECPSTSSSPSSSSVSDSVSDSKKDNNIYSSQKPKRAKKVIAINEADRSLANRWFEYALSLTPNAKFKLTSFEESLVKAKKEAGLNDKGMEEVFEAMKKDAFWKDKVRSPNSLLNVCKDGLRKIDHLIAILKNTKYKNDTIKEWAKNKTEELKSSGVKFDD